MKKDVLRKSVSSILSFMLSLLVFLAIAVGTLAMTVFNTDNIIKNMENVNFFEQASASIEDNFKTMAIPTGIPPTVFENIVSRDEIRQVFLSQMESITNSQTYAFDSNGLKQELQSSLETYAEIQSLEITDEIQSNLDAFLGQCISYFESQCRVPLANTLSSAFNLFTTYCPLILGACGAFALLILWLLYAMNGFRRATPFVVYGLHGGALMVFLPSIIVLISKFYERIHLAPEYVYKFSVAMVNSVLNMTTLISSIVLVLGFILIAVSYVVTRKNSPSH